MPKRTRSKSSTLSGLPTRMAAALALVGAILVSIGPAEEMTLERAPFQNVAAETEAAAGREPALAAAARGASGDDATDADFSPDTCAPWYHPSSPWRQPIGPNPEVILDPAYYVDGDPAKGMKAFWDSEEGRWLEFTSDTSEHTYPVHYVDNSMPLVTVAFTGVLSHVKDDGRDLVGGRYVAANHGDGDEDRTDRRRAGTASYRMHMDPTRRYVIPSGSDRQFIFINSDTGEEIGVWRAEDVDEDGLWEPWDGERARNGYVYNLKWSGYPPVHPRNNNYQFLSRGAGIPYGVGLIRRCEIERGRIDHVIAFAHSRNHDRAFVFPATKTDGYKMRDAPGDRLGDVLPQGQLVQLDPSISEETLKSWGCTGACLVIAKALQEYGMRTVDNSRSFKVLAEYESTAQWSSLPADMQVIRKTVSRIPVQHFRPIASPEPMGRHVRGRHDYGAGSP
jgi:hypothetical protein